MDQASIKLLLIEDNLPDCRLLRLVLGENATIHFDVTDARSLSDALARIKELEFDVILVDLTLPDSQGLATFERLHSASPNVPILVLSGLDDESLALQAVREGAQDYLVKGHVDNHILCRSITYAIERHRIEQALLEGEKHYRILLESITDYRFSILLENGRAVKADHGPGCVSVTGYAAPELEALPDLWLRMVHSDDRQAVLDQIARVLRGDVPPPLEHRIVHRGGHVRWVRTKIVPRRDRQGHLCAYDGLLADITERKFAEDRLITSEAFYHSLVENLPQYIFRKNLLERFTFANHRFCRMLGKPLEEVVGKTDFDFFPPELAAKYQRDDRRVIQTGKIFETIEENQAPSGEKLHVNVVKTPVYDANGQVIGIQGIFWDITERKRFEEQLQKANAELARSEAELRRSHEELKAAQVQLIQAEKMESVGTLAAGVAHEVKNPLAIVLMGVNFLSKRLEGGDDKTGMVLKEMREAIARAVRITGDLLHFSAAHGLAVAPESLNELIETTLRLVRHELDTRQVRVVTQMEPDLPAISVDKTQIQQVFVNLFLNAIHAMQSGGVLTLRTYCKRLTETRHFEGSRRADDFWVGDLAVVAEVEDTGTGIPKEHLAKIFDPFFTTKPTGLGTGLGLPISKKIIELHGGMIDIMNLEKGGVRATVMLKPQEKGN